MKKLKIVGKRLAALFCAVLLTANGSASVCAAENGLEHFKRQTVYSEQFQDVSSDQWFYPYVKKVYELGLVKGVSESLFDPDGNVTVAASLALACRLNNIYYGGTGSFQQGSPWYEVYVTYAIRHSIISSYAFSNYTKDATRAEVASILEAALPDEGLSEINLVEDNAIPDVSKNDKYADAIYHLYRAGIVVGSDSIGSFRPDSVVTRAETAAMISRIVDLSLRKKITLRFSGGVVSDADRLQVKGKNYYIGMSEQQLRSFAGNPDDRQPSEEGFTWYVYGIRDYSGFFMAGIYNNKVVDLCSSGTGFRFCGYGMGDEVGSTVAGLVSNASVYMDQNDRYHFYMINLKAKDFKQSCYISSTVAKGEAVIDYYLVNAFRQGHGCSILGWSEEAAQAARMHSLDMASNNYFAHNSQDGRTPWIRMRQNGAVFSTAGENLALGYQTVINAHNGLVNSAAHRKNMLDRSFSYVGVGVSCKNPSEAKKTYVTEDYLG